MHSRSCTQTLTQITLRAEKALLGCFVHNLMLAWAQGGGAWPYHAIGYLSTVVQQCNRYLHLLPSFIPGVACKPFNCWFCFYRHMRTQNTTRPHLWPSCIVSLPWLSHKLFSPSAIPMIPTPLTTHATASWCLNLPGSQPYVMALLVTLMLCCTSRSILAFIHPHTQQTWPVGFPYTFQSSSRCR